MNIDLQLLHAVTGCDIGDVQYLPEWSYSCGVRNCCYHHRYAVKGKQYFVEAHCGCESNQEGTKVTYIVENQENLKQEKL